MGGDARDGSGGVGGGGSGGVYGVVVVVVVVAVERMPRNEDDRRGALPKLGQIMMLPSAATNRKLTLDKVGVSSV